MQPPLPLVAGMFCALPSELLHCVCQHLGSVQQAEKGFVRLSCKALRDALDATTQTLVLQRDRPRSFNGSRVLGRFALSSMLIQLPALQPVSATLPPLKVHSDVVRTALQGLTKLQARLRGLPSTAVDAVIAVASKQGDTGWAPCA